MKKSLLMTVLFSLICTGVALATVIGDETNQSNSQVGINSSSNKNTNSSYNSNTNMNSDFNSNSNKNTNTQGQVQGQAQSQKASSTALSGSAAIQGQLGIVGQSASNDQSVNVGGDTNKTYANAWPSLSGGEGVSQGNAYSMFGGIGLSNTEKYKVYITEIQAVEASKVLTDAEKATMVKTLYQKMLDTNKKQRFLGLFWETSGKNLSNLMGLLAWDSFWKEGQHPFVKAK